jgi:hypothetical protein
MYSILSTEGIAVSTEQHVVIGYGCAAQKTQSGVNQTPARMEAPYPVVYPQHIAVWGGALKVGQIAPCIDMNDGRAVRMFQRHYEFR